MACFFSRTIHQIPYSLLGFLEVSSFRFDNDYITFIKNVFDKKVNQKSI